jgi:hypothetical protein
MGSKFEARSLVLTFLEQEEKRGINTKAFTTAQLQELHSAIHLANFGTYSKPLNKMRIKVMGELLLRGEVAEF